ncbi:helix-turn-helix domain-containing protein [Flavobacterium sp. 7A]|uniref:helix-turn-helix domain-containing protein n=1 Tax=Flavobacterium sp. 7A TaxID=2940571 RepID=UPI00222787B7|nr:AraC family transcriptional regulator [Flavobacterium sp. 7A]MCW2121210.1 AraC-like DNA-binding protein [Flavobacterium sp. 7A]
MEDSIPNIDKYYITKVDAEPTSIYCHHDLMGELFVPIHKHQKAQMLYTEGDVVFVTTAAKSYFLPARHFFWLPAGVEHSIHPKSENVMIRNLYFPVMIGEDIFYSKEGIYPLNDLLLQMMLFTNRWNGDLDVGSPNYSIANAIKAILPQICFNKLPLELPVPKDYRLLSVVDYIDQHIGESLMFPVLASMFGFSERSLLRLFQKDIGMSFIQYYKMKRILKSIELLSEKRLTVKEIAEEVGYNSVPTFSNTFYSVLGQRPSDYLNGENVLDNF